MLAILQVIHAACEYSKLFEPSKMKKTVDRWGADVAERLMCIFTHVRRLANSDLRFKQATTGMTDGVKEELRELIDKVLLDGNHDDLGTRTAGPILIF